MTEPEIKEPETIDTSDWETYRNETYGFEFKVPPGSTPCRNIDEMMKGGRISPSDGLLLECLETPEPSGNIGFIEEFVMVFKDPERTKRYSYQEVKESMLKAAAEQSPFGGVFGVKEVYLKRGKPAIKTSLCDLGCAYDIYFLYRNDWFKISLRGSHYYTVDDPRLFRWVSLDEIIPSAFQLSE